MKIMYFVNFQPARGWGSPHELILRQFGQNLVNKKKTKVPSFYVLL